MLLLGEPLTTAILLSFALILGGSVLATRSPKVPVDQPRVRLGRRVVPDAAAS